MPLAVDEVDRLHENKLVITQELISHLLGVRRESVTGAAGQLQKDRLIKNSRGRITVLDRHKLEERVLEMLLDGGAGIRPAASTP